MSAPTVQVLVGFQTTTGFATPFQLNNATYGLLDTGTLGGMQLVDLTSLCTGITITRGRNRETELFNAGTASIRFRDPDRLLDPLNEDSPYYPFVLPRGPVEIYAGGVQVYSGLVTDWDLEYDHAEVANAMTASCADAFTVLANQSFDAWTPSAETSGERVEAVLARPEISYMGAVSIDGGASTLGAFDVEAGTNVLGYLGQVTASEQGFMFISAEGTLIWRARTSVLNNVSEAAFSDAGNGLPYTAITNTLGDELLYNYVTTQSPAGAAQIASDGPSAGLYQIQSLSKTDLLNASTNDVAALGEYLLGRYKDPRLRLTGITSELSAMTDAEQSALLAVELTDVVSVERTFATGSPASVERSLIVSGIAHQIVPGRHSVTLTFEAADGNQYLTLDDSVFGVLDSNLIAF